MKEERLRELLEKYYSGETSPEEEAWLKEYLSGSDVPGYETEKELFSLYSQNSRSIPEPSADLETRIMASLDDLDKKSSGSNFRKRYLAPFSLAATVLIILGSYFLFKSRSLPADTYSDPKIAYAEAMKVLYEVSLKLNQGTDALTPVEKLNSATVRSLGLVDKSVSEINGTVEKLKIVGTLSDVRTPGQSGKK